MKTRTKLALALPFLAVLTLPADIVRYLPGAAPAVSVTGGQNLAFGADPYAAAPMSVQLPKGYATLDVSADPFA
jgi:hypothetical protein